MMDIGPERMVDNREPQSRFQELVQGKHPARLFLVRDERKRCGKSILLRRLVLNCRFSIPGRPRAAWVDLEEITDPSPFHLVSRLSEQLPPDGLPEFSSLRNAVGVDPRPFMSQPDVARFLDIRGEVRGDGLQVATGGQAVGVSVSEGAVQVNVPQWAEAMRPGAERMCLEAFERDLRALPPETPVALFIDSVDRKAASPTLREWVVSRLLEGVFLDPERRPGNAVLVVAGRTLPDYAAFLGDGADDRLVEPPFQADWQPTDTEDFLKLVLRTDSLPPELVPFFHSFIVDRRRPVWDVGVSALTLHGE